MSDDATRRIREIAIAALARREHSRTELKRKLSAKGFADPQIEVELMKLGEERLQDDARFAESYINHRVGRGYGPMRIRAELGQRGVDDGVSSAALEQAAINWDEKARDVWRKKFAHPAADYQGHAKQAKFLQYRGFTMDQIARTLAAE